MSSASLESSPTNLWETPKTLRGWPASVDHNDLGIRYLVTAFAFLANSSLLSPETCNQIFRRHVRTMIFWYRSPIRSGFGVYLIPLMIGVREMAFPRLMTDRSRLREETSPDRKEQNLLDSREVLIDGEGQRLRGSRFCLAACLGCLTDEENSRRHPSLSECPTPRPNSVPIAWAASGAASPQD
jgi:hypothetical protein